MEGQGDCQNWAEKGPLQVPTYFLPWDQCDLKWLGWVEQGWVRGAFLSATKKRLVAAGQLFHLRQAECPWSLQKEVRLDENIILKKWFIGKEKAWPDLGLL